MCTKTNMKEEETVDTMDTVVEETRSDILVKQHRKLNFSSKGEFRFYGQDIPVPQARFWKSPILIIQYAIVLVAVSSRHLWILQGILGVWALGIAHVVYAWICYIIRDPQLIAAISSMRWYFGFAMRQAEKTVTGGRGRRMVEGGFLAWRGTATSFTKWYYRQRSQNVNRQMILQHQRNMERLKQWQITGSIKVPAFNIKA
mmetsp:Transcript_3908/g.7207  ORF Transcript_3908/g.7207 Transcript_3908/m.7207 type:complete len:201 (+) Transcript_3908:180-782(+)